MHGKKAMGTRDLSDVQMMSALLDYNADHAAIAVIYDFLHGILKF